MIANKLCDMCGKPLQGGTSMDGAIVCRDCAPDLRTEIDALHAEGKPVDALKICRRVFRETHSAGTYLLRDIPDKLWQRAKHRAVDEKLSLRDLILHAVEKYLS